MLDRDELITRMNEVTQLNDNLKKLHHDGKDIDQSTGEITEYAKQITKSIIDILNYIDTKMKEGMD